MRYCYVVVLSFRYLSSAIQGKRFVTFADKLGIKDQNLLDSAEADYVVFRLKEVAQNKLDGDCHTEYFFKMHEYIFQDLFEWAGQPRNISIYKEEDVIGGQSIDAD